MWVSFLLAIQLAAPPADLPLGTIVDSVTCREQPDQTFALYLPSQYSPGRQWPIVIMLDPAARGRAPLERFAPAAESLGYIVVGSNNSRNGPLEPTIQALGAIWSEVSQRFSINTERIYLAGFSGGARMASQLAQSAVAAGVIACGAGLLSGEAERFPFAYAATAGRQDMNYLEVRVLAENLQTRGTRATFLEFGGGHDWPPEEVARQALEWLKLESIRRGAEPKNDAFLEAYRMIRMERAEQLEAGGQPYEALRAYESLAYDLEGLADVAAARGRARLLRDAPQVREGKRLQERTDEFERRELRAILDQVLSKRLSKGDGWWKKKLALYESLPQKKFRNSDDLSRRLLQFVLSYASEHAWFAAEAKEYPRALSLIRIALLARPESAQLHYRLARLHAFQGHEADALAALQKALDLGWEDRARLEQDQAFEALRGRPEFQQLLGKE